jgi:hypothetical protein
MKKDKEWLKGLINEEGIVMDMHLLGRLDEQYWKNENIKINKGRLFCLIDKLDEPEVLSQEWIDENKVARIDNLRKMTTGDVVPVEKLKNLIVPKQDKPVIPQFVVDYYNDYKYYELTFEEWFECSEFGKGGKTENKMFEWLLDNSHEVNIERQFIFADIIAHGLDGYEVEREKKYYIYDKSTKGYLGYNADKTRLSWYTSQFPNDVFTEQEIKAIDERYWAFAEEVKPCN